MDFQIDHAVAVLRRTPGTLNALLRGLPDEWITPNEGPDTWSPYDVVGHLIHGEETDWIPRARIILEHGEARPFDPFDRVAMYERSCGKNLDELLDRFAELRKRSLLDLERMNVTPEMLALRGTHPEFGPVTLGQLLSTWVTHDLGHIAQIVRVMAKQYREAVGPWRAYISIVGS